MNDQEKFLLIFKHLIKNGSISFDVEKYELEGKIAHIIIDGEKIKIWQEYDFDVS